MNAIKHFLLDENGASAVEYGLLVGLIAAVIVAAVSVLGVILKDKICEVAKVIAPGAAGLEAACPTPKS